MTHSFSVSAGPQLKVFDPVVCSVAIDVVDRFVRFKKPSKLLLHNEPMLRDVPLTASAVFHGRMIGGVNVDIPEPLGLATAPV